MNSLRVFLMCFVMAAVQFTTSATAQQPYPSRPIRFIDGFQAGGAGGLLARIAGAAAGDLLGQPMVIEHRPGAGSIIAIDACAKAQPDGYTICFVYSAYSFLPYLYSKLPFDQAKDLVGVTNLGFMHEVLMVAPSVPVKSVQELVSYSKAHPGSLNYASLGIGSTQHITLEWIKSQTGADITHVPFKGTADVMQAFMAGQVQVTYQAISSWQKLIEAGKARAIAVPGNTRLALLPDVPAITETGLPDFSTRTWGGVIAPSLTPKPILTRLSGAFSEAMRSPAMREKLAALGYEAVGTTPEEFNRFLIEDRRRGEELVRISGAKLD